MDSISVVNGTPFEPERVLPGAHYLVRVEDEDVTVKEKLDGTFEDLSENGTITAGDTVTLTFNSDKVQFTAASGTARLWITKSKVAG